MRIRTLLHNGDPYLQSKTRLQWLAEGRAINAAAAGEKMWTTGYCGVATTYSLPSDTHPATPEELVAMKNAALIQRRERDRKRREAQRAEQARWLAHLQYIEDRKCQLLQHVDQLKRQAQRIPLNQVICLDCETTGLRVGVDEVLQLSMIDGTGAVLINEYVKPERATEWPDAEAINWISPDMVADKPPLRVYDDQINGIFAGAGLIVGYNSDGFDLPFLRAAGITVPTNTPTFDVMLAFTPIYGEWNEKHQDYKWQKLATCASYYGYQSSGKYHNSLEDAQATLWCFTEMTKGVTRDANSAARDPERDRSLCDESEPAL